MLRTIRLLNLRRLAKQPLRAALAILAVAAGSSIIVALLITSRSVTGSITEYTRRLAGPTPLRVVGPLGAGGLDARVTDVVRGTPGVEAAIPMVQAVTVAQTAAHRNLYIVALGVDCSVEALIGPLGCQPSAMAGAPLDAPPILSASLARDIGRGGVIRTDTGRVAVDNAPVITALGELNRGRVAIFPLPVAQARFDRVGRLDAVYVKPQPGVDVRKLRAELARRVGSWNAVLGQGDPARGFDVAGVLIPLLGVIGLFAMGIGGLLVYNVVTLSLAERRRELALGSALGASRGQLIGGVLAESGVLGAIGGMGGAVLGTLIAYPVVGSISAQVQKLSGIAISVHRGGPTPLVGLTIGVVAAVLASAVPARRATRLDVSGELLGRAAVEDADTRRGTQRVVIIFSVFVVGIILSRLGGRNGGIEAWQGMAATVGLLLSVVGGLVFAGAATPLVLRATPRIAARLTGTMRLAITSTARESSRTTAVALAIGASIGLAGVLGSLIPSVRDGTLEFTRRSSVGRVGVSSLPFNNSSATAAKTSRRTIEAVRRLPGVADVSPNSLFVALTGYNPVVGATSLDPSEAGAFRTLQGRSPAEAFARGEVMVGPGLARSWHLRAGSTVRLPTPTGWVTLKVGGVTENPNANGWVVVLPPDRLQAIWGPLQPDRYMLRPTPGVSVRALTDRINAAHIDPDLHAQTADEVASELADDLAAQVRPFWSLQQALLLVALIATASTLLLAGVQRRRQHGLLAAVGMSPRDLARLALAEAALVGIVGATLGLVVSLGIFDALRHATVVLFGIEGPFRVDIPTDVLYLVLALVTVLVGASWPAWRTSKLEVVDALRYE